MNTYIKLLNILPCISYTNCSQYGLAKVNISNKAVQATYRQYSFVLPATEKHNGFKHTHTHTRTITVKRNGAH